MPIRVLVLSEYGEVVPVRPEAEIFVGLAKAGVEVTVMTPPRGAYTARFRAHGVRVIEWHPESRWAAADRRRIREELVAGRHDVMFLFNNTAYTAGCFAAVGLPVKVVAYRGYDGNLAWYDPTNWWKMLHPRIDAYWCNAESVRRTVRENLLWRKDRARAISKGHDVAWYAGTVPADLAALGVPADGFRIAFAANVRPMKGVPVLLEAMHRLPRDTPVRLVLMGDGFGDPELVRLREQGPNAGRIHLLGPRKDALEIMAACEGYVLSSLKGESLTKSLMESMSVGIPPVVTDVPGNDGIVVDRVCGRVVPRGDAAALAEAMADLASDPARARAWGAAAREQIRTRWSHAGAVAKVLALVEELAGRPARA